MLLLALFAPLAFTCYLPPDSQRSFVHLTCHFSQHTHTLVFDSIHTFWSHDCQETCSVIGLHACICDWFRMSDPVLQTSMPLGCSTQDTATCCISVPWYVVNSHLISTFKVRTNLWVPFGNRSSSKYLTIYHINSLSLSILLYQETVCVLIWFEIGTLRFTPLYGCWHGQAVVQILCGESIRFSLQLKDRRFKPQMGLAVHCLIGSDFRANYRQILARELRAPSKRNVG